MEDIGHKGLCNSSCSEGTLFTSAIGGEVNYIKGVVSRKHKPMSMRDRAAQFASFAALSGYEDMVEEKRKNIEAEIEEKDH